MINKRIVVPILVRDETAEQARRSISSVLEWRNRSTLGRDQVRIICVCADPEFSELEELTSSLHGEPILFCNKTFDFSRSVAPYARELFDEADANIGFEDLVLILAPGHILWDFDDLTKAVDVLAADPRSVFIVHGRNLPVAALFAAGTQRVCGLLLFGREGWAVEARWSFFGKRYVRVGDRPLASMPECDKHLFSAPWFIGAIACFVQERMKGQLWLRTQKWAE